MSRHNYHILVLVDTDGVAVMDTIKWIGVTTGRIVFDSFVVWTVAQQHPLAVIYVRRRHQVHFFVVVIGDDARVGTLAKQLAVLYDLRWLIGIQHLAMYVSFSDVSILIDGRDYIRSLACTGLVAFQNDLIVQDIFRSVASTTGTAAVSPNYL